MRELERTAADTNASGTPATAGPLRVCVVGDGRVGGAIARALRTTGTEVVGPVGRGDLESVVHLPGYGGQIDHESGGGAVAGSPFIDAVLLCVPDAEIASAARGYAGAARFIGHTSGATPLAVLGAAEAFGLHPLQTIPGPEADLRGSGCAVAGTTPAALDLARRLALDLGMDPVEIEDENRAAYHAAASIAANFLVTLEGAAERLAATAGVPRDLLVPLARAALENWAAEGAERALTGPVARGDEETIARQRAAVEERAPDLLDTFDALVTASRVLAAA
jgi:predicted short-subunit dehydrogenase-like oxidoreductase (DUF2520 family)